jgi:hypothetical protein
MPEAIAEPDHLPVVGEVLVLQIRARAMREGRRLEALIQEILQGAAK